MTTVSATGGIAILSLTMVGFALLWALRLVHHPREKREIITTPLSIGGWTLIYLGVLGACTAMLSVFSLLVWIAAGIVTALVMRRYYYNQRVCLLWSLALAAEKGVPLHEAAQAFADERSDSFGMRAARLADRLREGASLPAALRLSGNWLPVDAALAVHVGTQTGQLSSALSTLLLQADGHAERLRNVFEKLLYVGFMLLAITLAVVGAMIFLIPVMVALSNDFGLDLPLVTQLFAYIFENNLYLINVLSAIGLLAIVVGGSATIVQLVTGWTDVPGLSWFWRKADGAVVMQALAAAVRRKRSLFETLQMLSQVHPKSSVRHSLRQVVATMDTGGSWADAMAATGLARKKDAAVLKSAAANNHLAWALEETAERTISRAAIRMSAVTNVVYPIILLMIAFLVSLFAVAMFSPTVQIIEGLSG